MSSIVLKLFIKILRSSQAANPNNVFLIIISIFLMLYFAWYVIKYIYVSDNRIKVLHFLYIYIDRYTHTLYIYLLDLKKIYSWKKNI